MKFITIIFGILLTLLGIWNYAAEGMASVWSLVPAVYGLLAILFGFLQGRWEHKHPLFGAVMMAILTLIISVRGLWNLILLLIGSQPALSTELIWIRSLRGLLSIAFIALVIAVTENVWHHWKNFGHFLGDWLGRVVLTIFYFTVFVPFGIGVRFFGDPLKIKSQPDELWRPRETGDRKLEEVLRQF
jgi:hypothetical protein